MAVGLKSSCIVACRNVSIINQTNEIEISVIIKYESIQNKNLARIEQEIDSNVFRIEM